MQARNIFRATEPIAELTQSVALAKAGAQKGLKKQDSVFRRNDEKRVLATPLEMKKRLLPDRQYVHGLDENLDFIPRLKVHVLHRFRCNDRSHFC
jgi:hypothetical protein